MGFQVLLVDENLRTERASVLFAVGSGMFEQMGLQRMGPRKRKVTEMATERLDVEMHVQMTNHIADVFDPLAAQMAFRCLSDGVVGGEVIG